MKPLWSHILCPFAFLVFQNTKAITVAPVIQRACLDKTTGVATVYYSPITDACGSFVKFVLYGRDNSSNPFSYLSEHGNLGINEIAAALPNKKKWEFYIAALYACNGTDTLFSNHIFLDDTPPAYLEPDSISVDLISQKIIAGWSKAPEPDVMGYSIFKVDPGTGNNSVLDEQNVLFYTFNTGTFNPTTSGNRLALAAYDSCLNGGIISNFHSPILLALNSSQNIDYQCSRKIYMNWSGYVGWATSSHDLYVKDDITNTWSLVGNLPAGQFDYVFNIPTLGRTYTFFVRAHKSLSPITSTSNTVSFTANDFMKPTLLSIGHVSVLDDYTIQITGKYDITASLSKALLQVKNYGAANWTTVASFTPPQSSFTYIYKGGNPHELKYTFRLLLVNQCNVPFDSSLSHTSILLRRNLNTFYWNEYWAWSNESNTTDLLEKIKGGSTWNNKSTYPDSLFIIADTNQALCFKVIAILWGTGNMPIDTAYSNTLCLTVLDTNLVPNSFSPGGLNPVFKIINPNLLPGQALMTIYNRWGGKLWEGDALIGWDGTDPKGQFVGPGFYPYLIEIFRPEKREAVKGTVMILR